jgi:hypothetical protein
MLTQDQIQSIVRREVGNAQTHVIHDTETYQLHELKNREQVFVRKDTGWGYVSRPDEEGIARTAYEFGPNDSPKLLTLSLS